MSEIAITRATSRKPRPADADLKFGTVFTDHMFLMEYSEAKGWHDPRIEPYHPLSLDPAAMVLQYSQTIFEGLKAYRLKSGEVKIFRPAANAARFERSCVRMCIPAVDRQMFVQSVKELVKIDAEWTPRSPGTALYIRPTAIASEAALGMRTAKAYMYYVVLTPVGPLFGINHKPLKILVADKYVRSIRGGVGSAKTGGNYAATLLQTEEAKSAGFDQVLYLDGLKREYVDEFGAMNFMAKIGDEIVTPPLSDTILAGITRDSVLHLLREWKVKVVERPISINEMYEAGRSGRLAEVWAVGTGVGISAIGELTYRGERLVVSSGETGPTTQRIYNELNAIRYGESPDPYGWLEAL